MSDLDVVLRIGGDASGGEKAVKSIRQELREAQQEALNLGRKFGDTSKEAIEAQKRVAKLRDEVADFKQRVDALNPDAKFRAFSQSLQGVAGGFAGLQGAIGLFGTESKDLERQLLKVQSALALSQGLDAILESKEAFKNLKVIALDAFKAIRAAIGSTGIGLLVVALGTIVAYWDDIKTAIGGVSDEQKKLNETAAKNVAIEEKKLKSLNDQDNILKLQGLSEKQILERKIAQTKELIKQKVLQLELAEITQKQQLEQTTNNFASLVGTLTSIGVNAAISTKISSLFFNPAEVAQKGKETITEIQTQLTQARNQLAGYQLEVKAINQKAVETEQQQRNDNLNVTKDLTAKSVGIQQDGQAQLLKSVKNSRGAIEIAQLDSQNKINDAAYQSYLFQLELDQRVYEAKAEQLNKISALLAGFADVAGKNSAVGKALAIADATINTYAAANAVLNSKSPQFIVNPFLRFTTAALAIATGLNNVKRILAVKIPYGGGNGGGGNMGGGNVQSPRPPMTAEANVQATQSIGTSNVNVANQNVVRAYVVEKDITDSQDRIAKIKAAATI